ncbi:MAG: hypothetical protein CVT93_08345 [Bacteroidetes bacterium HGW-Bacteroidetes-10]|nr:MAG: hypothetical protein CVT93_08345 [Bacteroidetes bacterium HGW-Bacteroidetes-10]
MLLTEIQLVTAVRVDENPHMAQTLNPYQTKQSGLLYASLTNLCRRLSPAGRGPAPLKVPAALQPVEVNVAWQDM